MSSAISSNNKFFPFDVFIPSPYSEDISLNPYSDQLKAYIDRKKMISIMSQERAIQYITQNAEWKFPTEYIEMYNELYNKIYSTLHAKTIRQEKMQDEKNIKFCEKIRTGILNLMFPSIIKAVKEDEITVMTNENMCENMINTYSEKIKQHPTLVSRYSTVEKETAKIEQLKYFYSLGKPVSYKSIYIDIKLDCKKEQKRIKENLQKIDFNRQKICQDLSILSNDDCLSKTYLPLDEVVAAQLLQEEEKERQFLKKNKSKVNKQHKKKTIQSTKKTPSNSSNKSEKKRVIFSAPAEVKVQEIDKSSFIKNLFEKSSFCAEHPRVQRWKTINHAEIRQFVDRNNHGEEIYYYQDLDDSEIEEQKAKHFLPGTERLLKNSQYKKIYTFPTDRGVGMLAQLFFNHQNHMGYIYFGINQDQVIFHKYFENKDFNNTKVNIYVDPIKNKIEENLESTNWISDFDFDLDIFDDYTLKFKYSDQHQVYIFPINLSLEFI